MAACVAKATALKMGKTDKNTVAKEVFEAAAKAVLHDRDLEEFVPGLYGDPMGSLVSCLKEGDKSRSDKLYHAARRLAKDVTVHTEYRTRSAVKAIGSIGEVLVDALASCRALELHRDANLKEHGPSVAREPGARMEVLNKLRDVVAKVVQLRRFEFDLNRHKESKDETLANPNSKHGKWAKVTLEGVDITRMLKQLADAVMDSTKEKGKEKEKEKDGKQERWSDAGYQAGRVIRVLGWGTAMGERRDNFKEHSRMLDPGVMKVVNPGEKAAPFFKAEVAAAFEERYHPQPPLPPPAPSDIDEAPKTHHFFVRSSAHADTRVFSRDLTAGASAVPDGDGRTSGELADAARALPYHRAKALDRQARRG